MSNRMDRADAQIQKAVADIISGLKDPRLNSEIITVTDVSTSPDFTYTKIMVSILSDDTENKKQILKLLQKSSGFIKRELGKKLSMPNIPYIKFVIDNGYIYSKRIDEILSTLNIPEESDEDEEDF